MRVGELTKETHLSRPAVSHHLKILKEANLVLMRKEGTMNFYTLNLESDVYTLKNLVEHISELAHLKAQYNK